MLKLGDDTRKQWYETTDSSVRHPWSSWDVSSRAGSWGRVGGVCLSGLPPQFVGEQQGGHGGCESEAEGSGGSGEPPDEADD